MKISILRTCAAIVVIATIPGVVTDDENPPEYGVDISWPMHHEKVSSNFAWLPHNIDPSLTTPEEYVDMPVQPLGDIQSRYEKYMKGCYDYYNEKNGRGNDCWETEKYRMAMILRQVQSMRNYTTNGYTKIRAPERVFQLLKDFWDKNRGREYLETWQSGEIFTNHWETDIYFLSVEDTSLDGGGSSLKQHIWNAARDTMEMWTGQKQAECSLYGIRIYTNGSMLAPHVDNNPLVSSAIINVAQDTDEPWPLEVIGHDGKARNVTMVPGDMVLYESHSVIHGRQYPLKGRFMANVFVHFEPVGPIGGPMEYDGIFPPYVIRGSPEEENWHKENSRRGHKLMHSFGATFAHDLASNSEYDELKQYLDEHPDSVNQRDENGWTALCEAVRVGCTECVRLLLESGAAVNLRLGTKENDGSLLWNAKQYNGEDHEIVKLLLEFGANVDVAPEAAIPSDYDSDGVNEDGEDEDESGDDDFEEESEESSDKEEIMSDEEDTFSDEEFFSDEEDTYIDKNRVDGNKDEF